MVIQSDGPQRPNVFLECEPIQPTMLGIPEEALSLLLAHYFCVRLVFIQLAHHVLHSIFIYFDKVFF